MLLNNSWTEKSLLQTLTSVTALNHENFQWTRPSCLIQFRSLCGIRTDWSCDEQDVDAPIDGHPCENIMMVTRKASIPQSININFEQPLVVAVAQLTKWSFPTPDVLSFYPDIGKNYWWTFTVNCIAKTKIKVDGLGPFKKRHLGQTHKITIKFDESAQGLIFGFWHRQSFQGIRSYFTFKSKWSFNWSLRFGRLGHRGLSPRPSFLCWETLEWGFEPRTLRSLCELFINLSRLLLVGKIVGFCVG